MCELRQLGASQIVLHKMWTRGEIMEVQLLKSRRNLRKEAVRSYEITKEFFFLELCEAFVTSSARFILIT